MATSTQIPSAENILAVFARIDLADVSAGIAWYADARAEAERLGVKHGYSAEIAAGVIAALSPLNEWGKNLRDADRVLGGSFTGYLSVGLDKARRIMAGEDIPTVLSADKTSNFWRSIVTEGREGVTIDRHAWDIAVGMRNLDNARSIGKRAYREAAAAYVIAAETLAAEGIHVTPAELQSVTWEAWRAEYKYTRA